MAIETLHAFVPQNQIANVVDAYHGLLDLSTLPSYYEPTHEGTLVAARIIDLAQDSQSQVELVFGDGSPDLNTGLLVIAGPDSLQTQIGDTEGPSSFLWNQGPLGEWVLNPRKFPYKKLIENLYLS